jgi:F-type H+-transporting ATPase subunit gamma
MPSLKDLRNRIRSVKSTQKITAAMKMVAAAKLRRAQEQAEAARPYAQRLERMMTSLAMRLRGTAGAPPLLSGSGRSDTHLIVVATSDRATPVRWRARCWLTARRSRSCASDARGATS